MPIGTDTAPAYTYNTIRIARFGFEMPVALREGSTTQYFPVRHICTWLGIDAATQRTVLHSDSQYVGAVLDDLPYRTETRGWRPAMWIRRDKFAKWLLDIDAKKCQLGSREKLQEWQAAVLKEADALLFGATPPVRSGERGAAFSTVRVETHMNCLECGAPHHVIIENGHTTVLRVLAERDE